MSVLSTELDLSEEACLRCLMVVTALGLISSDENLPESGATKSVHIVSSHVVSSGDVALFSQP